MIDLDAYFHRIGHTGERTPTLETLRALQARHVEAIPFENLNPLLGRPVRLDLPSLEQKLVHEGRGGYCYEQNLLFRHVLETLGFRVTGFAARVLWYDPNGTPRTHVVLQVDIDGDRYLTDVAFGSMVLTGPLRFEIDVEQTTPHEPFRLVRAGDEFVVQALVRGAWKSLYQFDLQPQRDDDYEVVNWYVSTHPGSPFVSNLLASRVMPDRRYALRNNEFSTHHLGGPSEHRTIVDAGELRGVLEDVLRIRMPEGEEMEALLQRLVHIESPDGGSSTAGRLS